MDKPVLLTSNHRDGLKTPALPAGSNRQMMKSILNIQPDGSLKGEITVSLKGGFAENTRSRMRNLPREQEKELVKNVFKAQGYVGSGDFDKEDPKALLDSYRYGAKFEVKEFLHLPGPGAFAIVPLFNSEAPIYAYLATAMADDEEHFDTACANGHSEEEFTYQFPKGTKIVAIPSDFKLSNDFVSYSASYRRKGNTLNVHRVIDDRTPGNVCTPAITAAYKQFAAKVLPNLRAQVIFQ